MNQNRHKKLEEYYQVNICSLIFKYENQVANECRHKFFTYNYDNEISNFVKTFTEYLPYYVSNYDQFKYFEADSKDLLSHSRRLWTSLDQKQNFESNGIFGELFLDFYRRIYGRDDIIAGYAIRKEFSSKEELKGIDNFSFCVTDEQPTIIFSEAKFVKDLYGAAKGLIDDINEHLEPEFINKFSGFIMRQSSLSSTEHTEDARLYLDRLNEVLVKENLDFISAINELNYKAKLVQAPASIRTMLRLF